MQQSESIPKQVLIQIDAPETEQFAAKELIDHLAILGIDATVDAQAEGPAIHIGKQMLGEQADTALARVRDDGFILYQEGDDVYIAGQRPRGTLFGCYQYLESLGLRWPQPGQPAEQTGLIFSLPRYAAESVNNPDFPTRGNYCYCPVSHTDFQATLEIVEWMTRQRYNLHSFLRQDLPALTEFDDQWYQLAQFVHQRGLDFALATHLGWAGLLLYEDRWLFQRHPEYFPLKDGRRIPYGHCCRRQTDNANAPDAIATDAGNGLELCVSNPKVIEQVIANLHKFLDAHPEIDVLNLWAPDGRWEGCQCPDCTKLLEPQRWTYVSPHHKEGRWRVTSDHLSHFLGQLSAGIHQSHPHVRIRGYAWCTCAPAPQNIKPAGDIGIDHVWSACFTHTPDNELCQHRHIVPDSWQTWARMKTVDFGWTFTGASSFQLVAAEFPFVWLAAKTASFLHNVGGNAISHILDIGDRNPQQRSNVTDHYSFSSCGITYFAIAKLGWNVNLSPEKIYNEFAHARFGSQAGSAMSQYYCQMVDRYESWQHAQPRPGCLHGLFGSSEIICRAVWEIAIDAFTEQMIARSRELFDQAYTAAIEPIHQQRIALEKRLFDYTLCMRRAYLMHVAGQKLQAAGDCDCSRQLHDQQRRILNEGLAIDLPVHTTDTFFHRTGWIRNPHETNKC